jgi:hypothetical protein
MSAALNGWRVLRTEARDRRRRRHIGALIISVALAGFAMGHAMSVLAAKGGL